MPLKVEHISYGAYVSGSAGYEQANILDTKRIVITFSIERIVFASDDNIIHLTPPIGVLGSVDNERIIYCPDNLLAFEEFHEGDSIILVDGGTTTPFTIEQKIDSQTIRVAEPLFDGNSYEINSNSSYIACVNAPKGLKYFYNFISDNQSENYINHLDNELNVLTTNTVNTLTIGYTYTLNNVGSKSHQIGTAVLDYIDRVNNIKLIFTITQTLRQYPFLREDYKSVLSEGEPWKPFEDWEGDLSYSHIFKIEMLQDLNIEDDKLVLESLDNKANTGAFNESFNTGTTKYSVESVEYKIGSQVIDSIDYNQLTKVKIIYKSDARFADPIKIEVALLGIQEDFDYYKDKSQTYEENFCLGIAGTTNITNISTPYRVFTDFSYTVIDASALEVNVKVSLGDAIKANLDKSDVKKYLLLITSEPSAYTPALQKRSRDIVDFAEFSENLPTLNILNTVTKFHLDPSPLNTGFEFDIADTFMTDDVQAVSVFSYPESMPIKLIKITNQVVATNGTSTVVLDSQVSPVSGYPLDPFGVQLINVDQLRPLNQSYKANTVINRGVDSSGNRVFNMAFPFVVGYREDKPIINQNIPVDFFDNGAVGNGLSSDWYKYGVSVGWDIFYKVEYVFEYQGKTYEQETLKLFNVHDYDNPEWTAKSIKIYDESNNELISGGNKFIRGNCRIEARFSKPSMPVLGDCFGYLFIASTGQDGYRTSSTYDNTLKKIIFGSLTLVSGDLVLTGFLNANEIQSNCRIWARIFERGENPALDCVLLTEDDYLFEEEGGEYYLQPETCEVVEADFWANEIDDHFINNEGDNFIIIN